MRSGASLASRVASCRSSPANLLRSRHYNIVTMPKAISSDEHSIYFISDSELESSSRSKAKSIKRKAPVSMSKKRKSTKIDEGDIEDTGQHIGRPHNLEYHSTESVEELQEDLLAWFEDVRYGGYSG
jgi:hypothetical protein